MPLYTVETPARYPYLGNFSPSRMHEYLLLSEDYFSLCPVPPFRYVAPHNQNRYKQLLQGLSVREYSPIGDVALKVLNIPGQLEIHY